MKSKKIAVLKKERNKLFPGKIQLVDLYNARYITRKPIYDFLISHMDCLYGSVLDFGCGGMEYKKILKNAEKYSGLDIEGAQENGFWAEGVVYYDGIHIPFENRSFDSVMAIEVFEHVEYLDTILGELNRILRGGGIMLLTVPMNFPGHLEPYDFRRFTKYGIMHKLKTAGFEVEEIKASTTFRNTLRRLHILELEKRRGRNWRFKIACIFYNICFCLSNDVKDNEKAPIDWMVVCRKLKEV